MVDVTTRQRQAGEHDPLLAPSTADESQVNNFDGKAETTTMKTVGAMVCFASMGMYTASIGVRSSLTCSKPTDIAGFDSFRKFI